MNKKDRELSKKAAELVRLAEKVRAGAKNWIELHNAVFGLGSPYAKLFATPGERTAFGQTEEHAAILAMIEELRGSKGDPAPLGDRLASANGHLSIRLPKAIHAALLAEADAEGVSLNQLCAVKLTVQLRSVV
jgi:hypothetical protein